MIRTAMKILGVMIVLVLGVRGVLFLTVKTVTQEEAERIATQKVQRYADESGFDAAVFQGPELVDVQQWGYAFQWRFADPEGTVNILVWVDKHGGTEISGRGNLERLRKRR